MKTLQMQSCVHENATVECALVEITVPEPEADQVVVAIDAAPINPSDLGLMFGAADLSSAALRKGRPTCTDPRCTARCNAGDGAARGHWMPVVMRGVAG